MTDHEKRIREALGRELTGEKWESDGAGVYSVEDSDFEVAVCFTQDADDAAYIAACDPSAIRALLAELDAVRGALLKIANDCDTGEHTDIARTTIAQQAQEPVAWHTFDGEPDHTLKTDPDAFDAVAAGIKTYEIRKDDRGYKVGDKLLLKRTRYTGNQMFMRPAHCPLEYTGEEARRVVSHIQRGYGLGDDWVILSFATTPQPQPAPTCGQDCDCLVQCGDFYAHSRVAQPAPQAGTDAWISDVLRSVAELPDRTSPDDQPDMMLVTADELRQILTNCAPASPAPQAGEVTYEQIESCALAAGFSVEPSTGAIWAVDGYVGTRVDPGLRKFTRVILALRPQAVPMTPLEIFSHGPWLFQETGQTFTGAQLDEAAFVKYRAHHGITAQGAQGGEG